MIIKGMKLIMTSDKEDSNHVQERRWAIVSLASIPLIMTSGNSMLIPILPLLENELQISKLQSSLIITSYSLVAIFLIPVAGFLSDRYGRKKVMIPALLITGIGGLVAGGAARSEEHTSEFQSRGHLVC